MLLSTNFTSEEFRCKCPCQRLVVDARLVRAVQQIRDLAGVSVTINSGYRCSEHNKAVGGEPNSEHMTGRAADISATVGVDRLRELARDIIYIHGIGTDRERGFLHVDVRDGSRVEWTYKNGKAVNASAT